MGALRVLDTIFRRRNWCFSRKTVAVAFVALGWIAEADDELLYLRNVGFEIFEEGRKIDEQAEIWNQLDCSGSEAKPKCQLVTTMVKGCNVQPVVNVQKRRVDVTEFNARDGYIKLIVYYGNTQATCAVAFRKNAFVPGRTPILAPDELRAAHCSYPLLQSRDRTVNVEMRLPEASYEFRPSCGYWMMGRDNKQRPSP